MKPSGKSTFKNIIKKGKTPALAVTVQNFNIYLIETSGFYVFYYIQ